MVSTKMQFLKWSVIVKYPKNYYFEGINWISVPQSFLPVRTVDNGRCVVGVVVTVASRRDSRRVKAIVTLCSLLRWPRLCPKPLHVPVSVALSRLLPFNSSRVTVNKVFNSFQIKNLFGLIKHKHTWELFFENTSWFRELLKH